MTGVSVDLFGLTDLPQGEIDWFLAQATGRKLAAGAPYCRIGQRSHEFGILRSGILLGQAFTTGGEKVVLDFIFPGMAVLALDAAIRGIPSEVEILAVTDAELWVWPYAFRLEAFERHIEWRRLEAVCLEQAFVRKQQRFVSLRTETSRERFRRLGREFPPEWATIPQGLIASYLAITPQYLSRLRREAREAAGG